MFPTNMTNHFALHAVRQSELEAAAQDYRLAASVKQEKAAIGATRKHIGTMLISLGQKLAQESGQETQLVFSTK